MISLDSPVTTVLGDARSVRQKVEKGLGIRTVGDLLGHHPRRYLRTGELTRVDDLQEGDQLTVVGDIVRSDVRSYTDRRSGRPAYRVETVLQTDGPTLLMTFFAKREGVASFMARKYAAGRRGIFVGRAGRFKNAWQLTNPEGTLFGSQDEDAAHLSLDAIGDLFPIYPLTAGVHTWDLQRAISFARTVLDEVPELLPEEVRRRQRLVDARTALDWVHAPSDLEQVRAAQRRYRFDEALVTQLVLARRRRALRELGAQARDGGDGALLAAFDERLPFELTAGQRTVGEEIVADLVRAEPMNRLLQGEVGSGKTLVALRAMLHVIDSGGQAALLAPTEVLAQQHHRSISAMLGDLAAAGMLGGAAVGTTIELLTGSMGKARRTEVLSRAASGEAGIVIGTHALLEDPVSFADLALVVVDEQHRFGVEQRAALTDKAGSPPHVLVMTATPIPRTVAMTVFGDLEVSTLRELPVGRAPIQTNVVPLLEQRTWWGRMWERVREEVAAGHQVYVVCPRIDGDQVEEGEQVRSADPPTVEKTPARGGRRATSETTAKPEPVPLTAVVELADDLAEGPLAGLRLGVLHGRLPAEEKDRTMRGFAGGDLDVLVATTVIEVGVDVANATMMVLMDADRFGVSQLHQLRGRVGRGGLPGLCLLVTEAAPGTPARERLAAVAATTDGFELARVDLDQRREGDVLGKSQSGYRSGLQTLRVLRDEETILAARSEAHTLLDDDASLRRHPLLGEAVQDLERSVASEYMEKS